MNARRWLLLIASVLIVGLAVALYSLPELVRRVAVAQLHALTERPVSIERVGVALLEGRFTVHGFRLAERDGRTPFADFEQLDVRVHLPSLLRGHLWIREMVLNSSTVRVVRVAGNEFNFSDLIRRSGTGQRRGDITVDHFVLRGGTVTLEDRALPEWRTWTSEQISLDARNVSTRRDDGHVVGRSVTAGAPVALEVRNLRLYPIHLEGTVTVDALDLTLARVYLPADWPVVLHRGRATMSIAVVHDARDGLRADATGRFEDLSVGRPEGGDAIALVPHLTSEIQGFAFAPEGLRLARLSAEGTMRLRDATAKGESRYQSADMRASIADLTWPATTPGRVEVHSSVPGGGRLAITGMVRPAPEATQLRVRLTDTSLAAWAELIPLKGRVSGVAEADLRIDEPIGAGVPARLQGSVAVKRLRASRENDEVLRAERVAASGFRIDWPTRISVDRVTISGPRATVERDRSGAFPVTDLVVPEPAVESDGVATTPAVAVEVGEITVRDGALSWRDQAVSPPARLEIAGIDANVKGIGWPLRGPAGVRASLQPPGGGRLAVTGDVTLEPLGADLRVTAKNAELAPYQPYLPTAARISGATDLDIAVVVPSLAERQGRVRGTASLSRLDVRDRERTLFKVERASATSLDVDWPHRVDVGHLALARPWVLLERDDRGALPLRALLTPPPDAAATAASIESPATETKPLAVTVARLRVERGGIRLVDRAVSPAFAVDFQPATLSVDGLSTAGTTRSRLDLAGQLGPGAELKLTGTLGPLGGPLRLDVRGEVREFAVPRTNPYLLEHVGWKTTEGRLASTVQCRVDGDALSARADIRLSRLQLVPAAPHDGAEARIGLPLRMITALMKDKRGDITMSFPVGGRLSDPRFDFSEALWGAIRSVAINAITLPVSWIGRVRFTPDSRIENIEVDPIQFEPGTADLTSEGRVQISRLAAFLDELPDVNISITPVISARDVESLERRRREAKADRPRRDPRPAEDPATPASPSAMPAAVATRDETPESEARELAERRLEAVRATARQANIDPARLKDLEFVRKDDGASAVALEVLPADDPRPSKLRDALGRLGVRMKDGDR